MQMLVLAFAISLIVLGALLNTLVLGYFLWRVLRVLSPARATTGAATVPQRLARANS